MVTDPTAARRLLEAWAPPTHRQADIRDEIVAYCARHPDALARTCRPGHLTASAIVVDATGDHVLLHLHRKLGKWLQLGGHCDGDADLAAVALKESTEESGIETGLEIDPEPLDCDIHTVEPPGEDAHLHLDTCFLVRAPAGAEERISTESIELRWLAWADALHLVDEPRLTRLLSGTARSRAAASR